jgi:cholesterol oxidase
VASNFDVIVVGSGFGGAVTACRLAEAGMRVLVLERGRRWQTSDYPRAPGDAWVWSHRRPERQNGWVDFRIWKDMAVAMGAGVGGGSLIYASVSLIPHQHQFDEGWPPQITWSELQQYYARVGRMLNVQPLPANQLTRRYELMRDAAEALGKGARFKVVPQAVTFSEHWSYDLEDAHNERHSRTWVNEQGQTQGTCIHCGNCDIGCQVKAKNTLDLNYIPWAEKHGAEVRALHLVTAIEPMRSGYRVLFDRLADGRRIPGSATADRVVLGAGSIGSTELLLRCRDQHGTLPRLSRRLGCNWSFNGDFVTPAVHRGRTVSPTRGPTISSAIDFLDGSEGGQRFLIEDGGFPDLLADLLQTANTSWWARRRNRMLHRALGHLVNKRDPLSCVMPWFAQGIDAGDGRLRLGIDWWRPWAGKQLKLDWDYRRSEAVMNAIVGMHVKLAKATAGVPVVPFTWSWLRNLVTPHPLGGCNMGTGPENGVVDHRGAVFGYPGLYVADGAIVPEALGMNPSRTIAALAERIATLMIAKV